MSAVEQLSETYDYNPHAHDYRAWWDHHRALVRGMEPAQWTVSRFDANALFTESDIIEIRERYAAGVLSQMQIAESYGCDQKTIHRIVTGENYRNVGGPLTQRGAGQWPPNRRSA